MISCFTFFLSMYGYMIESIYNIELVVSPWKGVEIIVEWSSSVQGHCFKQCNRGGIMASLSVFTIWFVGFGIQTWGTLCPRSLVQFAFYTHFTEMVKTLWTSYIYGHICCILILYFFRSGKLFFLQSICVHMNIYIRSIEEENNIYN